MTKSRIVDLFVYGTLRPGQHLWSLLEDSVVGWSHAETRGKLYMNTAPYPYAKLKEPGSIHGDWLACRDTDQVRDVIQMERKAGYQPIVVPVWTGNHTGNAIAFHWPFYVRKEILSGDFLDTPQAIVTVRCEQCAQIFPRRTLDQNRCFNCLYTREATV